MRKASELCDVDAIAFVGAAFDDLAQKDDASVRFVDGDVIVDRAGNLFSSSVSSQ